MIYITYTQLAQDVIAWSEQLPRDIDAFIAVPRSGVIPASMLSLHRNVHLGTVDELANGRIFQGGYRDQHPQIKKVMVIDDSLLSGRSMVAAAEALKDVKLQIHYGVVYLKPGVESPAWFHFKKLPMPRIFEWNWMHHYWMGKACVDIDGVLCRDPTYKENDDSAEYRKFLSTVHSRHIPTVEINTLVTSRLERYRPETVAWLKSAGIRYKKLVMHPAKTAEMRRMAGDHAKRKAAVYKSTEYGLFIESSHRQAQEIHALTAKPVLCTDLNYLFA